MFDDTEYNNWHAGESQFAKICVDALAQTIAEGRFIIHPDVWTDRHIEPIFEALELIVLYSGKKLYVHPCVSDQLRVLEQEGTPGAKIAMSRLKRMDSRGLIELPSVAQSQKADVDTILIHEVKSLLEEGLCVSFMTLNQKLQQRLLNNLSLRGPEVINTHLTCPNVKSLSQVCEFICKEWVHLPKAMQQERFVPSCCEHVERVVAALKALEDDQSDWPALDKVMLTAAAAAGKSWGEYDWSDQSLLANHPISPIVQALFPAATASPEFVDTWRSFGSEVITFLLSNGVEQSMRRAALSWLQFMMLPFLDSFGYQRYEVGKLLKTLKQEAANLSQGSQISIKNFNPSVEDINDVGLISINDPEVSRYVGHFAAIWNDWWEKLESKKNPFARIDDELYLIKV